MATDRPRRAGLPSMRRLLLSVLGLALLVASAAALQRLRAAATSATGVQPHVLRYAFRTAETSLDPAAVNDLYSRVIIAHLFEGLYTYDPLARPARVLPQVAAAMPEIADDFRRWTIRLKPGIRFSDDPAFNGRPRVLAAADFVYGFKRFADPAVKSPVWGYLEQWGIVGLAQARREALDGHRAFDYDKPVAGLRALDPLTLEITLAEPRPHFLEVLAGNDQFVPIAREVAEAYPGNLGAHPVGAGPFRLAEWRRASRIVLARNPQYRERIYEAHPAADDAAGQALLARMRGRRLPLLDRVEIAIIEESQPRWLSFLNHEADFIERMPEEFIDLAMPAGELAPGLRQAHAQSFRMVSPDVLLTYFNMEDPLVGGYDPAHVALRRAIGLGVDTRREARLARHGQMIPAQSQIVPHTIGYDPAYRSEMGDFDPARARALLDLFGYVDRDGDGWREQPDGRPLVLEIANQDDQAFRQFGELWQRNMTALGLRVHFRIAKWPENLKAARAGRLMMWDVGSLASAPDGQAALERLYGPSAGGNNLARFRNAAFDAIYRQMLPLPDGPAREALFLQAKRLAVTYMPYKARGHRIVTDLAWPQVVGYRRPLFGNDWWEYVDVLPPVPGSAATAAAAAP